MGDRDPAHEVADRLYRQNVGVPAEVAIARMAEALRATAAQAALAGIYHECQGEQPLGTALRWQARVAVGTGSIECPDRWWEDEVCRGD